MAETGIEAASGEAALQGLIGRDQLAAVCRNVRSAIPVNFIIACVILLVGMHYHRRREAALWFAAATVINGVRIGQGFWARPREDFPAGAPGLRRQFRLFCLTALASGCVWACIPGLCDYGTGPHALFYLTVICGITAGAITQGAPHAPIPSCFVTPPLLSIACCLLFVGGFDHDALAVTVLVYNIALIRFAMQGEAAFLDSSRLKNEALTLAESLREAHANALAVAEQMTLRAAHDGLTGLLNRSGFMQETEARLRDSEAAFCLMLLDLDGFKSVNDVYGHHAGDKVLIEVARRISEALSGEFLISRLGGDEFAIFYERAAVDAEPSEIATRLVTSIEVPFASFDAGRLGACVGVYAGRGRNATEMLTYADEALYFAKTAGRNRLYVFDERLRERSEMRHDIERDLQRALDQSEVEVWYQPIFSRARGRLASLEALLRWRHPRHGQIPPEELIMVAAMSGLAEALLRHVFGQVRGMIAQLSALGLRDVSVAMNISPREISSLPIDEILLSGLRAENLSAGMLEIEITEETAFDIRSVQDKLIRLTGAGIRITVDDFGVGYSSLGTLRQSYIRKIKIDYSFIRGVSASPENQILVQAILNLGRSLDVQVVCEGVENLQDLEWLEHNGGDLVQGYFMQQPGPGKAVAAWLQQSPAGLS